MKDLIVVENLDVVPFFTKGDQIESVLERLREEATSYIAGDLSLKKNRDEVKAMVTKFTKSKTYLESKGKELAAEYKAIPKVIDANRKIVKDTITELQELVRKPLTEWEDEQKAIEAAAAAEKAAAELAKQVAIDHEVALLLDEKYEADKKIESDRIEQERIAYEAELKAKAVADAKAAIEEEKADAIRREQRAIIEKEQAEQREKQLRIDAENAEKRRVADIEAAKQAQIDQQKAEKDRIIAEQKARDEDKEHRDKINNMAMSSLVNLGLTDDQAKTVVIALVKGQVPNATLTY